MAFIGAATWLVAPAIAFWALWERSATATLAEPGVVWVGVAVPPASVSSDADLVLLWSDPATMLAPQWDGIVQDVLIGPGDEVADGTELCVIDNVRRVAWHTEVPLFRSIAWGDHGNDVAALNEFLAAQGLPHDSDDTARASTARGIAEYAKQVGAGATSTFDPGWLVYLPQEMHVVDIAGLVIGAPAPAPGTEIVLGESAIVSATLAAPPGPGDAAGSGGDERLRLSGTETVTHGSVAIPVSADGVVDLAEALATVTSLVEPGEERLRVEVLTEVPKDALAIPYGAIVSDDGGTCVARRTGGEPDVVRVELTLPGTGRVYVLGPLSPGDEVLVPPRGVECSAAER